MSRDEALRLAQEYGARGVPAGPVGVSWDEGKWATSKRPLTAHGFKDFTIDEESQARLFRAARLGDGEAWGVGLWPGPAGLMVLDVDVKNGARGDEQLHDLERQHGELPLTWRHQSASGGLGIWFRKRPGGQVNNAWVDAEDHTGIDLRGDAGFIMAPGTRTPWGSWMWETDADWDTVVADCPGWLATKTHVPEVGAERVQSVGARQIEDLVADLRVRGRDQDAEALDVLCRKHGGHHPFERDGVICVTRPEKRSGASASIGKLGPGIVKVWSTAWPGLPQGVHDIDGLLAAAPPRGSVAPAGLGLRLVRDVAAEVDASRPLGFLFEPIWPEDAYGVGGAGWKVGKTWFVLDAAVAVATGGSLLGAFSVQRRGAVTLFLGEGGARKMTRRGRAVADSYGHRWDDLDIYMAERTITLTDEQQRMQLRKHLDAHPCALVVVDPLYLAAPKANSASLYDMAAVLNPIQQVCQEHGSALMLVHHTNRKATAGSDRASRGMSGAGPAEWGRVLVTMEQTSHITDDRTGMTEARLTLHVEGDEVAQTSYHFIRKTGTVDPTKLDSPMRYEVQEYVGSPPRPGGTGTEELMQRILDLLGGTEMSQQQIKKALKADGGACRDATLKDVLDDLVADGELLRRAGPHNAHFYRLGGEAEDDDDPDALA